jgi:glyoxylase-like metal-dependent hydrolase (beta-lactamase superfamily II)
LNAALHGAAGLTLFGIAAAPATAKSRGPEIGATPLTDELTVFTGAGANVVALRGPDGLLLVDGGLEERSRDLLDVVFKQTGRKRVHTLFNTHWHPEQTGSNERLAGGDTRIIAHENTKLWLGYKTPVPWENRSYGPLPPKARPNATVYGSAKLTFGDEPVDYGYLLQAHTDGDIYVKFARRNVLVTGGAVSGDGWPVIDWGTGGWIGGMVDGLKTLIALADANTRIVPANGPVLTRADLEAQRDMYAAIFDRLGKLLRKGLAPDEVVAAAPAREFDAKWGNSDVFVTMAFKSLWGHFAPDA